MEEILIKNTNNPNLLKLTKEAVMIPEKSPENFELITYLWVLGLATLGGVVQFLKKWKNGRKWKWSDLLIDLVTAAFAGLTTFFICEWIGIPQVGAAALTGISGHFSSKAINLFGKLLERFLNRVG